MHSFLSNLKFRKASTSKSCDIKHLEVVNKTVKENNLIQPYYKQQEAYSNIKSIKAEEAEKTKEAVNHLIPQ